MLYGLWLLEHIGNGCCRDVLAVVAHHAVYYLHCFMENVSEYTVVHLYVLVVLILVYMGYVGVVEPQRTAYIAVDGGRRKCLYGMQLSHHLLRLVYLVLRDACCGVLGLKAQVVYACVALHHELRHEAASLPRLAEVIAYGVGYGHIGGALQHAVEVVGVDSHFVVDGGESVSLAYGVGDE